MNSHSDNSTRSFHYHFKLKNGQEKHFVLRLNDPSMEIQEEIAEDLPEWTRLQHCQCENCPLSAEKDKHCPIAARVVRLADEFSDLPSTEVADITISNEDRQYHKEAPIQYGVRSMLGVVMVTSGCPVMDKLRPMVYTHLPFPTMHETLYRAMAMYLVAQFLKLKRGEKPDLELNDLVHIYDDIAKVNQAFGERLASIHSEDTSLNALANLDCHGSYTAMSITENYLVELEELFHPYFDKSEAPSEEREPEMVY